MMGVRNVGRYLAADGPIANKIVGTGVKVQCKTREDDEGSNTVVAEGFLVRHGVMCVQGI